MLLKQETLTAEQFAPLRPTIATGQVQVAA